jgi:hypothetical protein
MSLRVALTRWRWIGRRWGEDTRLGQDGNLPLARDGNAELFPAIGRPRPVRQTR